MEHVEDHISIVFTYIEQSVCRRTIDRGEKITILNSFLFEKSWDEHLTVTDALVLHLHKVKCSGTLWYHCKKKKMEDLWLEYLFRPI